MLTGVGAATEHPGAQLAWSELVDQTGHWTLGSPALRRLGKGWGRGEMGSGEPRVSRHPAPAPAPGLGWPGRPASLPGERHWATQTGWEGLAAGWQPKALPSPGCRDLPPPCPAQKPHPRAGGGPESPPRAVRFIISLASLPPPAIYKEVSILDDSALPVPEPALPQSGH